MLALCDQCNQHSDIRIVKGTDTVVCTNCQDNPTMTKFMIQSMRTNKDYLDEKPQGFTFMCDSCGIHKNGVVDRPSGQVVCTACDKPLKVTPFMVSTMKELNIYREG